MIYSSVIFNEAEHSYVTPEGKKLQGITGMIDRQIFGGKYLNTPDYLLKEKAEYGSLVHSEIDTYFTVGIKPTTPEAKKAIEVLPKWEETEYLVNDDYFATKIDFVSTSFDLYDYKTSRVLDVERLSWQLSVCAYLFEHQTGLKAGELYGLHLRGDNAEIVPITRKPDELVLRLLEAEKNGEQYFNQESEETRLNRLISLENMIIQIEQQAEEYKNRKNELLAFFESKMSEAGMKKIETDKLIITKVEPTEQKTIDTALLKKDLPDIAEKYQKTTQKKGFIKLTIKK